MAPGTYWLSAQASEADFSGARLIEAMFDNAVLLGATFRKADLALASFDRAKLFGARFDGATGAVMLDGAVDVGEHEAVMLQGAALLDWLHQQGGTELTAFEP